MKIYNTLTKKIEEFIPITQNEIKMYVCGPTVYNLIHIGNARPVIFFDVVARYFKYIGYKVNFVQNFTDVDDKIINKAISENKNVYEISEKYIEEFMKDIDKLNISKDILRVKVTENIDSIIDMVSNLLEKKYAYKIENDVFFDISKYEDYGKLSNQDINDLKYGNRIEVNDLKHNPYDFVLWKSQKTEEEIAWSSPFGKGRPGWHIECSALIKKYLGNKIDIHGGGSDLIFPHHENEIAQSCCSNDTNKLSNYFMHNAYVIINNEKMSKSLGNTILVRDLLEKYGSDVVRVFMINTHYRKPINFSDEEIKVAQKTYNNLISNISEIENIFSKIDENEIEIEELKEIKKLEEEFKISMENDFNTSNSFSTFIQRIKIILKVLKSNRNSKLLKESYENTINEMKEIFGLILEKNENKSNLMIDDIKPIIELLLEIREDARKNKNYELADKIRDVLKQYDFVVQDKKI